MQASAAVRRLSSPSLARRFARNRLALLSLIFITALIALAVLVITQCLNFVFVPLFAHAGLALAIGVGALINALWLLIGLIRSATYVPRPGWGRFSLQVLFASAVLAVGAISS